MRHNYSEALKEYKRIENILLKRGYTFSITGSMRREKCTIGDIDIIIRKKSSEFEKIMQEITKFSRIKDREQFIVETDGGIEIQFIFQEEGYIYNLWTSTGSKSHVKRVKEIYSSKNIELPFDAESEEEIYKRAGMEYIKPQDREEI
ncbi:MAG: hypothetical protein BWY64_02764 [bacterium ADurb.Bin363]|nr:MAG: hypothetical protein BWY64_02764 [bacterium ADurb.Bin363]